MFKYNSPEHKCDNRLLLLLLLLLAFFISDNFYGLWFVFFDNTRVEGLLLMKGGMYRAIREIESKSYKESFLKFWSSQHCWYSCHHVQSRGLNK
jgi:hypothetical protein